MLFYNRYQSKLLKRIDIKRFGKVLRQIRGNGKIAKVKLACVLEITVRIIDNYENGDNDPPFENIVNFAMFL